VADVRSEEQEMEEHEALRGPPKVAVLWNDACAFYNMFRIQIKAKILEKRQMGSLEDCCNLSCPERTASWVVFPKVDSMAHWLSSPMTGKNRGGEAFFLKRMELKLLTCCCQERDVLDFYSAVLGSKASAPHNQQ
jgi:hypothetical protein